MTEISEEETKNLIISILGLKYVKTVDDNRIFTEEQWINLEQTLSKCYTAKSITKLMDTYKMGKMGALAIKKDERFKTMLVKQPQR